jgi:hypothetical protein
MARLEKLTSERSQAFHKMAALYVELTKLHSGSPEYQKHCIAIAAQKAQVMKLQRQITITRMKKAERYLAL